MRKLALIAAALSVVAVDLGAQEIVEEAPGAAPVCVQPIHKWALPSSSPHNFGYYVGGGALSRKRGEQPSEIDGTWGWDYRGWIIPRVDLLWWHGRRYQGGSGRYQTDGPRLPELHRDH
ncbi:MAG: hypothetical protein U0793_11820 [Gemmataceae bacterium]